VLSAVEVTGARVDVVVDDVVDDVVDEVVVIVGITKTVVVVDEVVDATSEGSVVVVVAGLPTTSVNIALLAKL
jgi:hypothetical protein